MKKNLIRFLFLLIAIAGISLSGKAATMGADLTYVNIAPNTYVVQYKITWDCNGAMPVGNSIPLTYQADGCNTGGTILLNMQSITNWPPNACSRSCRYNTITKPNNYDFTTYYNTLTLPGTCTNWKLSVTAPGRIAKNLDSTVTTQMYSETVVNNQATNTNTSVTFGNDPVFYACVNNYLTLLQNVTDLDGDSLSFSLQAPRQSAASAAPYTAGYATATPFGSGVSLMVQPLFGSVSFTPTDTGRFALRLLATEYRRINGVMTAISETSRDIMVIVESCPPPCVPVISSPLQAMTKAFPFRANVKTCYTFNVAVCDSSFINRTFGDPTGNGPYYTYAGTGLNRTLTFCWKPAANLIRTTPYQFSVTIRDNACPIPGFMTLTIQVQVTKNKVLDPGPPVTATPPQPGLRLAAPNIITPNNDGKNDAFVVQGMSDRTELQIFDRNKRLLYSTKNYKGNWQAEGLKEGVYFYQLKDHETGKVITGTVEVIR